MSNATRSGTAWTQGETNKLIRNRSRGKTYSQIASMTSFSGKRTLKALRRRFERVSG
ncbi:MAG: hypothetical protein MN733_22235 [Nitrososphaera sp.]|nr:hypothetical protein [Nitrososphaera sp.]